MRHYSVTRIRKYAQCLGGHGIEYQPKQAQLNTLPCTVTNFRQRLWNQMDDWFEILRLLLLVPLDLLNGPTFSSAVPLGMNRMI